MAWAPIVAAGISAAGSLAGGLMGRASAQEATGFAREQLEMQREIAEKNLAFQRDAAQMGIRWKAADAQAAGLHPLFAMGAPPFNPSPVSIGGVDVPRDESWKSFSNIGQDISRAVLSTQTKPEKEFSVHQMVRERQELERGDLQNMLLAAQIAKLQSDQTGPAGPSIGRTGLIAGQGNMPSVGGGTITGTANLGGWENKPPEVTTVQPGNATHQSGPADPYVRWFRSGSGLLSEPNKQSKAEDEFGAPLMADWLWRNRLMPNLGVRDNAPPLSVVRESFPGATGVYFDHLNQKWMPLYNNEKDWMSRYIGWRQNVLK